MAAKVKKICETRADYAVKSAKRRAKMHHFVILARLNRPLPPPCATVPSATALAKLGVAVRSFSDCQSEKAKYEL